MKKEAYEKLKAEREEASSAKFGLIMSMKCESMEMGLGMGGSMRQEIYDDEYGVDAWDLDNSQRCFIMLTNAEQWMAITGEEPPLSPISAEDYSKAGLPWFDYYGGDRKTIEGAKALGNIKSIKTIAQQKHDPVWPEKKSKLDYMVKKIKSMNVSDGSW
jgi:hypothetical protein